MLQHVIVILVAIATSVLSSNSPSYVNNLPQHYQHQSKSGITYTVSSMEIQPTTNYDTASVEDVIEYNIKRCENAVPSGSILKTNHVLVYPEYSITSTKVMTNRSLARKVSQDIPWPIQNVNPCMQFPWNSLDPQYKAINRMSCLAMQHNVYIVAHFIETEDCIGCNEDSLKLYSAAVAFNNQGYVVAKYRKFNMYEETAIDAAPTHEISTFTSDFGVKFGIIMSFDLMFESPAMDLTENFGITEILISYSWAGVLPFLTALQMQQGWSFVNNVNTIAGCYLKPSEGYSGCGMFVHDKVYTSSVHNSDNYIATSSTITIDSVNNVEITDNSKAQSKEFVFRTDNLTAFTSVLLEKTNEITELEVCQNSLCCKLTYQMSEYPDDIYYQLLVFDGIKTNPEGNMGWNAQICGLVACSGDQVTDCGDMPVDVTYSNLTEFNTLNLIGSFNSSLIFPSTLLRSPLSPINTIELSNKINPETFKYDVELALSTTVRSIKNVHTFGLHSHDFNMVNSSTVIKSGLF